jgi:flagellar biosynthetic protein FliR
MIPNGFAALEPMLLSIMLALLRPGAAFLAAPVFGMPAVPVSLRLVVAIALGLPGIRQAGITAQAAEIVSVAGLFFIMGEVICGLAFGFALQIGFAAALLGGELVSNNMGLGFASMNDPIAGHSSPAVGQLMTILATFLFFATDGHLQFARIIAESYQTVPPGGAWPSRDALQGLLQFGGLIFSAGLSIALPVGFALVLVQVIMGVIGRSAPSLNLFAVGMPVALIAGIILMAATLPAIAEGISRALTAALEHAAGLARG